MKDVKDALTRAFLLAKQHGIVLQKIEFNSLVTQQLGSRAHYVQLTDINIEAKTLQGDQE